MKEFNEAMIKNYKEFNNCGIFEIEGYTVKFDNHSKTLETEYPYAKELRVWWFDLEEESKTKEDRQVAFLKEQGFEEVTEVAVRELASKTTKTAKFTLDRIKKLNHRIYKRDDLILIYGEHVIPVQEKKQIARIYKCEEVEDASKYYDRIGMWLVWNNL